MFTYNLKTSLKNCYMLRVKKYLVLCHFFLSFSLCSILYFWLENIHLNQFAAFSVLLLPQKMKPIDCKVLFGHLGFCGKKTVNNSNSKRNTSHSCYSADASESWINGIVLNGTGIAYVFVLCLCIEDSFVEKRCLNIITENYDFFREPPRLPIQ